MFTRRGFRSSGVKSKSTSALSNGARLANTAARCEGGNSSKACKFLDALEGGGGTSNAGRPGVGGAPCIPPLPPPPPLRLVLSALAPPPPGFLDSCCCCSRAAARRTRPVFPGAAAAAAWILCAAAACVSFREGRLLPLLPNSLWLLRRTTESRLGGGGPMPPWFANASS